MRKRVTVQEFADYFDVTRPTIHAWLRRYNEANKKKYDPKNIQSAFEFFEYLQKQFYPASFHKERDEAVL